MNEPNQQKMQPEAEEDEKSRLRRVVKQLAGALERSVGPGDLAALRRLDPADPACPAFFRLSAAFLVPAGLMPVDESARDEVERRWGAVLSGMAIHAMHQPNRKAGAALAEAGYSELRFVRLLRAEGAGLRDAVRAAARFLSSKAQPADWHDFAQLVLSDGFDHAEQVRRQIARDYYANLPTKTND